MKRHRLIRKLTTLALLLAGSVVAAQTTATGTINATLVHKGGIALVFNTDPAGVVLGNTGTAAASVNFGTVSAFGPLSAGVARPTVTVVSYTVRTLFDVNVLVGGGNSPNYTLAANLAAPAPTGFTYGVDAVTLTTTSQNVQTNAAYGTNIQHSLNLTISTAPPGAGGPAVGTPLSTTINFTATAN
jgi:hypothetical protein